MYYSIPMKTILKKLKRAAKDLCFPPTCLCCKKSLEDSHLLLCEVCVSLLEFTQRPFCLCCGKVFAGGGENHLCGVCLKSPWFFHQVRSLFVYEDTLARLVYGLKYSGKTAGLLTFQRLGKESAILADLVDPDLILPVPLHPKRLRKRGFNQAVLLARAFFPDSLEKIKYDMLIRKTNTPFQTGLSGTERRKNLRNAFEVQKQKMVAGKKIVLVDDVFTTGTTVNECARVLRKSGAVRVDVLTLARVRE